MTTINNVTQNRLVDMLDDSFLKTIGVTFNQDAKSLREHPENPLGLFVYYHGEQIGEAYLNKIVLKNVEFGETDTIIVDEVLKRLQGFYK
jgi:hypothetical protein